MTTTPIDYEILYNIIFFPVYFWKIFYDWHASMGAFDLYSLGHLQSYYYPNLADKGYYLKICRVYSKPYIINTDTYTYLISETLWMWKTSPDGMVHQYTLLLEQNPNLRIILRVNQNALEIYRELTKIIEKTGYENSIYVVLDDNDKYTRMWLLDWLKLKKIK